MASRSSADKLKPLPPDPARHQHSAIPRDQAPPDCNAQDQPCEVGQAGVEAAEGGDNVAGALTGEAVEHGRSVVPLAFSQTTSLSRALGQMLLEEGDRAAPREIRSRLVVARRPRVDIERVVHAMVHMKFIGL